MRRINKWFNPAAIAVVDLEFEFDELEKSFEAELTKTYGFTKQQKILTDFRTNELTNDHSLNSNTIIETFILAALLLFSALEEADWLCFSANTKNEDEIEDDSTWNIYRLLPFSSSFR